MKGCEIYSSVPRVAPTVPFQLEGVIHLDSMGVASIILEVFWFRVNLVLQLSLGVSIRLIFSR